jgi:predicted DNA-binding protein
MERKAKALPLRLDPELHQRLKEIAELEGATMVQVVREALDVFLPKLAARHASELEATLDRLREIGNDVEARTEEAERIARAEVDLGDELESDLVVERRGQSALTQEVLEAFGDMG